jgi:hypothetical protein
MSPSEVSRGFPGCGESSIGPYGSQTTAVYLADRLYRRLKRLGLPLGVLWLRPTDTSLAGMRAAMLALRRQRCPVRVFIVHGSELIPRRCRPSPKHVAQFIGRGLDAAQTARQLGARPATLAEAARWVAEPYPPERLHAAHCHSGPAELSPALPRPGAAPASR